MKKFTIIALAVTFAFSLTLSARADWVGDYGINGKSPMKDTWYDASDIFNDFFGKQAGINNPSDLLNARGVDPYTTWTANDAKIIGGYNNEADFDHHLRVFNGDKEIGYTTSINNLYEDYFQNIDNLGSGTDVSFELGAYWSNNLDGSPDDGRYLFHSGETKIQDGQFHMLAFDVTDLYNALWEDDELYSDVYMFAWEDQWKKSDYDYNDLIVFMTNVEPNSGGEATPEPATMAVLGLGLAGLGLAARRRRK